MFTGYIATIRSIAGDVDVGLPKLDVSGTAEHPAVLMKSSTCNKLQKFPSCKNRHTMPRQLADWQQGDIIPYHSYFQVTHELG